jgi:hypothetical protein
MWTDSLYRLQSNKQVAVDPIKFTTPGKLTLLANVRRAHQLTTHKYCDYLLGLKDRFNQVAVLIHNDSLWSAESIRIHYPGLEVLLDRDNKLLKILAGHSQFAKEHPTNLLIKRWNFQIVFNGNNIDQFYEVPIDYRWHYVRNNLTRENIKQLINAHGHYGVKLLNKFFNQSDQFILDNNQFGEIRHMYAQLLFYPGLWPNEKIELYNQKHIN